MCADLLLQFHNQLVSGFSPGRALRSEEHTSELQSQSNLVCRLLLEKNKHSTTALRHLHTNYNQTGATSAAANPLIDFLKPRRFLRPMPYSDSYFTFQGNSLRHSHQT